MDKAHFIILLQKYLLGKATKAERQFLLSYYELFDNEPEVTNLLNGEQKEALKNQIRDSIWQNILQHEEARENAAQADNLEARPKRWRMNSWWFPGIPAAALVLALCLTGGIYLNNKTQDSKKIISQTEQSQEQRLIRLPDGSMVIISKGSKLDYPASYQNLATREVFLEGQAYFDVKHDSLKPFIVHAGSLKTTVLGTSFSIKAWPEEVDVSVRVSKGKVSVADQFKTVGTLVQDQHLTFSKEKSQVIEKEVESRETETWKSQDLLVDDVSMEEITELLKERFDVDIVCQKEVIQPERFTITILKNESLEQVLRSVCEFNDAVYEYNKDKASVMISRKATKK